MHTVTVIWDNSTESESSKLLTAYPQTQVIPKNTPNINLAKINLGSYLSNDIQGPIVFVEANLNPNVQQPLEALSVDPSIDVAYMSYDGSWYFPEQTLNAAFQTYGMPHTSLIYFKNVQTAKAISTLWLTAYQNTNKLDWEERAFLLALQEGNFNASELDQDWIGFTGTNSNAYFNYLTNQQLQELE